VHICFLLKIRQEKVEDYKKIHTQVWPEMQAALRATGWRNYSIFLKPDGQIVGYLETDNFEKSCADMKNYPVNARWQAQTAPLFEALENGAADDNMFPLEEVFHLD
jgi:L-rhamnose mutarotase